MEFTKEFLDAVENKDENLVKIMLKNMMLIDKSFKKFDAMLEYAAKNMPNLFDQHNEEEFRDSSAWDKNYMNSQLASLVTNFSKERIELLKKIIGKLYVGSNKTTSTSSPKFNNTFHRKAKEDKTFSKTQIAAGGIAVLAGAGLLFSLSKTAFVVGGIALVGGVGIVLVRRSNS